ncbi:MAG TPA: hypothetical protein VGE47_13625, partial [Burkholderiaceae bacterium]
MLNADIAALAELMPGLGPAADLFLCVDKERSKESDPAAWPFRFAVVLGLRSSRPTRFVHFVHAAQTSARSQL